MRVKSLYRRMLAALPCLGLLAANRCPLNIQETKLVAPDGAAHDYLGGSVSLSGDVAVVGAYGGDHNGDASGSAYVYRFDGTSWVEEAKLLASDGAFSDVFGRAVSVSGDVAVIGAPGDDNNSFYYSGSAYVFRFDGRKWVEEAKLLASDRAVANGGFGFSVAVSGDTVVSGAYGDDDNGWDSGSAYVYRFDGTNWVEKAKLLASDGGARQSSEGVHFGESVSVSGEVAVVGAPLDDYRFWNIGSAYVFSPLSATPECGDGRDNDGDGLIDFDGGLSVFGAADPRITDPDPQCVNANPYKDNEAPYNLCGLGVELALLLPPLIWLYWRRGRGI